MMVSQAMIPVTGKVETAESRRARAAALGDKIYVCGGVSWDNVALATVEAYDTKANKW